MLRRVFIFLAFMAGMLAPLSPVGAAEVDDEAEFVVLINELRASRGLPTLQVHPELVTPSRDWAEHLAKVEDLVHASDLTTGVSVYWVKMGENIGTASTGQVDELFDAFVQSPSHLENLVDPEFEYVGVGVFYDAEGRMWTTHRFMSVDEAQTPGALPFSETPMDHDAVSHLVADLVGSGV